MEERGPESEAASVQEVVRDLVPDPAEAQAEVRIVLADSFQRRA